MHTSCAFAGSRDVRRIYVSVVVRAGRPCSQGASPRPRSGPSGSGRPKSTGVELGLPRQRSDPRGTPSWHMHCVEAGPAAHLIDVAMRGRSAVRASVRVAQIRAGGRGSWTRLSNRRPGIPASPLRANQTSLHLVVRRVATSLLRRQHLRLTDNGGEQGSPLVHRELLVPDSPQPLRLPDPLRSNRRCSRDSGGAAARRCGRRWHRTWRVDVHREAVRRALSASNSSSWSAARRAPVRPRHRHGSARQ